MNKKELIKKLEELKHILIYMLLFRSKSKKIDLYKKALFCCFYAQKLLNYYNYKYISNVDTLYKYIKLDDVDGYEFLVNPTFKLLEEYIHE